MTAAAEPLELRLPDRAGVEHRFVLRPRPDAVLFSGQWRNAAGCEIDVRWTEYGFFRARIVAHRDGCSISTVETHPEADQALARAHAAAHVYGITADDLLGAPA